jgi:hypothetical protein
MAACAPRVGRVQRQIRRLLVIRGQMNAVELAGSIYARPTKSWHRWNVKRAAVKFCVRIRGHHHPVLWKLNDCPKSKQFTDSSICSWEIAESFQWGNLQLHGEIRRFAKLKEIWRPDD